MITDGLGDACPIPRQRYLDWETDDPARPAEVRINRDEIDRRVQAMVEELPPDGCAPRGGVGAVVPGRGASPSWSAVTPGAIVLHDHHRPCRVRDAADRGVRRLGAP